jgi:hypothetical protein
VGAPYFVGAPHFVGAPPSGRFLVVCEAYRDEGVAPTGGTPRILWEPRPRGDGGQDRP